MMSRLFRSPRAAARGLRVSRAKYHTAISSVLRLTAAANVSVIIYLFLTLEGSKDL